MRFSVFENPYLSLILILLLPWIAAWITLYLLSNMWLSFGVYHFLILVPVALKWKSLWIEDLKVLSFKTFLSIVLFSSISVGFAILIFDSIGSLFLDFQIVRATLMNFEFKTEFLGLLSIYFITVNPVLEELFWRGTIQNRLKKIELPARLCVAIASICFGAWHYMVLRLLLKSGYSELVTLAIIACGFGFGYLYERTRSLTVPIVVHSLVCDLPIIVVLWKLFA